jgi:hypothetical protein
MRGKLRSTSPRAIAQSRALEACRAYCVANHEGRLAPDYAELAGHGWPEKVARAVREELIGLGILGRPPRGRRLAGPGHGPKPESRVPKGYRGPGRSGPRPEPEQGVPVASLDAPEAKVDEKAGKRRESTSGLIRRLLGQVAKLAEENAECTHDGGPHHMRPAPRPKPAKPREPGPAWHEGQEQERWSDYDRDAGRYETTRGEGG